MTKAVSNRETRALFSKIYVAWSIPPSILLGLKCVLYIVREAEKKSEQFFVATKLEGVGVKRTFLRLPLAR